MLFPYRKNIPDDHDRSYIEAKTKIDVLCCLIVSGRISRRSAENIYLEIESEFGASDPEKRGLFNMIYKSRIDRLRKQFCEDK